MQECSFMYRIQFFKVLIFIIALQAIFLFCTFNIDNKEPLTMRRVGNISDTVSIWPRLTFIFSVPIKDNHVDILIIPDPGPVYSQYLNETKDTLTISVTGMLQGNTRYVITPDYIITAENGNKLYPDNALFEIITLPAEIEPNNNYKDANILFSLCYGTICPANDTDYFYITNLTAESLYIKSIESKSGFFLCDTLGFLIAENKNQEEIKVIDIPNGIIAPLYAGVYSLIDNGARYELGIVK